MWKENVVAKSSTAALVLVLILVLTSVSLAASAEQPAEGETARYVVVFDEDNVPGNASRTISNAGGTLVSILDSVGVAMAKSDQSDFAARLESASGVYLVGEEQYFTVPDVQFVSLDEQKQRPANTRRPSNRYSPSDTNTVWGDYEAVQWNIRRVQSEAAWDITTGSHNTVVAVIDTGIATNHPDLEDNVVYTACYSTQETCSEYPDLHWHGTHVAGTVAANFNGGVVGVGPDLGLASYNVFELMEIDGELAVLASSFAIWEAMIDAAEQDFDVINMSLGAFFEMSAGRDAAATWAAWTRVSEAVAREGVTIVASAGNANLDLNGQIKTIPSDVPSIVGVGATGIRPEPEYPHPDAFDVRAFYSNFGASVDIVAPGGDCGLDASCDPAELPDNWFEFLVLSAFVDASPECAASESCPVDYTFAAGTSMAAPHVSGVAGLVLDDRPDLRPQQVQSLLTRSAESLGDRQQFGHGMVSASDALE
jgi:lantibiotic leader peptide-processing serine protease